MIDGPRKVALTVSRTKRFDGLDEDEFVHFAGRIKVAKAPVLDATRETVELFHQHWNEEKNYLPLYPEVVSAIERHLGMVPIYWELSINLFSKDKWYMVPQI
ncbi:MAG: hypothetical protein F4Y34_01570 [Gammaproteobacteria bacterium]|nr:hypothetical protein [Gammaproteobacteria bacterium]MYH85857.1 hypothetical protein [Gammaproteobacteria bacterium]